VWVGVGCVCVGAGVGVVGGGCGVVVVAEGCEAATPCQTPMQEAPVRNNADPDAPALRPALPCSALISLCLVPCARLSHVTRTDNTQPGGPALDHTAGLPRGGEPGAGRGVRARGHGPRRLHSDCGRDGRPLCHLIAGCNWGPARWRPYRAAAGRRGGGLQGPCVVTFYKRVGPAHYNSVHTHAPAASLLESTHADITQGMCGTSASAANARHFEF
jgi:hypothetical protein